MKSDVCRWLRAWKIGRFTPSDCSETKYKKTGFKLPVVEDKLEWSGGATGAPAKKIHLEIF